MDSLLPSEIARLVLGYLEEEKCTEAAKCFLDTSPNLSEIRGVTQRGLKYRTRVDGYSLKDLIDEYCIVHSIVQECVSSSGRDLPSSGSMIDCLRSLVKTPQPVQVHINLLPQQGQVSATSKSESLDPLSASCRPRPKKTSVSQEHSVEAVNSTAPSQPVHIQILPDNSSGQKLGFQNNVDRPCASQQSIQNCHLQETQSLLLSQNLAVQPNTFVSVAPGTCKNKQKYQINNAQPHHGTFQTADHESYHGHPPETTAEQLLKPGFTIKHEQHQQMCISTVNETVMQTVADFVPQSQNSASMNPAVTLEGIPNASETVQMYTTNCYGSQITVLPIANSISQLCSPAPGFHQKSSTPDPGNGTRKLQSGRREQGPRKSVEFIEGLSEEMSKDNKVVTKVVEFINKGLTPAKESNDTQPLDEYSQIAAVGDKQNSSEDTVNAEVSQNFTKKKPPRKKCGANGKQRHVNLIPKLSSEGTSSKDTLEQPGIPEDTTAVHVESTPAKLISENDITTPMSWGKVWNAISTPCGEIHMDSAELSNLLGSPSKDVKQNPQSTSSQVQTPHIPTVSKASCILEHNGMPIEMVQCNSRQEFDQFINQTGVKTCMQIEMRPSDMYVPILPKPTPDVPDIPGFGISDISKPKRKSRPRTRGGCQSGGQARLESRKEGGLTRQNTVTLYASHGSNETSSTFSYCIPSDMPNLVSEATDAVGEAQQMNTSCVPSDKNVCAEEKQVHEQQPQAEPEPVTVDVRPPDREMANEPPEVESPVNSGDHENQSTLSQSCIAESKDAPGCDLPSLNASTLRNTPGLNGRSRSNDKRLSHSTPRRRLSHIRTLDFGTPHKEDDKSFRKANTSPKNMSTNPRSPHTAAKMIKSAGHESRTKSTDDDSRGPMKAKAHLFQSPEYIMALSSGYKAPSSAVTSTPVDAGAVGAVADSPLPRPSSAWDEVGGVSLILDSPAVTKEPACKKQLKSWDSDLRSILGNAETELPAASRKRKINPAALKKAKKKMKTQGEEECCATNTEKTMDAILEASHESESEMAKLLEDNLANTSSTANLPVQNGSPSKETKHSPPKSISCVKEVTSNHTGNDLTEEKTIDSQHAKSESSCAPAQSECEGEQSNYSPHSKDCENGQLKVATDGITSSHQEKVSDSSEVTNDQLPKNGVTTPVPDQSFTSTIDRIRLNRATWQESISFDTPEKNDLMNIVPKTPRFLEPSSESKEDTPRTKIIKAIPLPISSADNSIGTPLLSVPPTPTIRSTPSVSPTCPAYFQPEQSSSPATPSSSKTNNHEKVLRQVRSKMEADCRRESIKKVKSSDSGTSEDCLQGVESHEHIKETLLISEEACIKTNFKENPADVSKPGTIAHNGRPPIAEVDKEIEAGCARLRVYPRKTASKKFFSEVMDKVFPGVAKNTPTLSDGESDECLIISPSKSFVDLENEKTDSESIVCQPVDEASLKSVHGSYNKTAPSQELVAFASLQINSRNIEDALDRIHGKKTPLKRDKSSSKSTHTPKKFPLDEVQTSLGQNQTDEKEDTGTVIAANHTEDASVKDSFTTPEKVKSTEIKIKTQTPNESLVPDEAAEKVVSDRGSSDSSDSSSSSESDTNSSSSSSCSSEEGTPVKEDISTLKMSTPGKATSEQDALSPQTAASLSKEAAECVVPHPAAKEMLERQSSQDGKDSIEEQNRKSTTEPNLKTLIQTKDMGSCERNAKIRSAYSGASNQKSELEQKKQRTLEQLKRGMTRQSVKDCIGTDLSNQSANQKSVDKDVSVNHQSIPHTSSNVKGSIQITKDNDLNNDQPKKRRSKSETDENTCGEYIISRRRIASDRARISDEDEFKLHLSGDEKEDSPPLLNESDDVEIKLAALHGGNVKMIKLAVTSEKSIIIGSQRLVNPEANSELPRKKAQVPQHSLKVAPRHVVSSKANDDVIRSLMVEGLGISMPPLPPLKIKKTDGTVKKVESAVKLVESKATAQSSSKEDSVSSLNTSDQITEDTSKRESHHSASNDMDCREEILNRSTGKLEKLISYNNPGPKRPIKHVSVCPGATFEMGDCYVRLVDSDFVNLFESTSLAKHNESELEQRQERRSVFRRIDSGYPLEGASRRLSQRSGHVRKSSQRVPQIRSPRDRSPRDRISRERSPRDLRHHIDSRPRGIRSSPKVDKDFSKGSRRRKDYNIQFRNDHPKRLDLKHCRRHSDAESRAAESSNSRAVFSSKALKELKSPGPSTSKSKRKSKGDAEDGEIVTSDSDFEITPGVEGKGSSSLPSRSRPTKRQPDHVLAERGARSSQKVEKPSPSSLGSHRSVAHRIIVVSSPEREKPSCSKSTRLSVSTSATPGKAVSKRKRPQGAKDLTSDLPSDTDLDNVNFPQLGDDDGDERGSIAPSSPRQEQMGVTTRRRAPPRSVNAHKVASAESKTPIQRGKRKLSMSPDGASEDSCQGSVTSMNSDYKQNKKTAAPADADTPADADAPAAKAPKLDESGDMTNPVEFSDAVIKAVLSILHPPNQAT